MKQLATQQSRHRTRLSGMLLSSYTYALCLCCWYRQNAGVVTAAFVGGLGRHLSRPAQVNHESKVCQTNGACGEHVGLEYALRARGMSLIRAFTRCGGFPVHLISVSFSSLVKMKSVFAFLVSPKR